MVMMLSPSITSQAVATQLFQVAAAFIPLAAAAGTGFQLALVRKHRKYRWLIWAGVANAAVWVVWALTGTGHQEESPVERKGLPLLMSVLMLLYLALPYQVYGPIVFFQMAQRIPALAISPYTPGHGRVFASCGKFSRDSWTSVAAGDVHHTPD